MSPPASPSAGPLPLDPQIPQGQPLSGGAAFGQLVQTAIQEQSRTAQPGWILRSGELEPQLLCRYAVGKVSSPERSAVQELITRHDWARGRVTSLVMAGRQDAAEVSLGRSVLAVAEAGGVVDPYRISVVAALKALEAPQAAEAVDRDDRDGFAALAVTGLPQLLGAFVFAEDRNQGREALAAHEATDGCQAVELARRVAALADEDEALVELLQAI